MLRSDIINAFIAERNFTTFLEIGTEYGANLSQINAPFRFSVDPNQRSTASFVMTSDDFFEKFDTHYDIIFIDGLHEHNQVWRDINHSLAILNPGGVIILHDCLPASEHMQEYHTTSQSGYAWTGDVWKAIVKARAELPYEIYTINADMGCAVIDTTLKKKSKTSKLLRNMETMTYQQFLDHPEWMNVKEGILHAE